MVPSRYGYSIDYSRDIITGVDRSPYGDLLVRAEVLEWLSSHIDNCTDEMQYRILIELKEELEGDGDVHS